MDNKTNEKKWVEKRVYVIHINVRNQLNEMETSNNAQTEKYEIIVSSWMKWYSVMNQLSTSTINIYIYIYIYMQGWAEKFILWKVIW